MGLFKTTNETHYHISEKAAIQQRLAARQNRKAVEEQASATRAEAYAQEEAARQQRKADEYVAKQQRKGLEAQLKHEKEMRLLEVNPEAYYAEEQRKKEMKKKYIKWGIIGLIVMQVFGILIAMCA